MENEEEDADYMGLAMFLSLSECGFFASGISIFQVMFPMLFSFVLGGKANSQHSTWVLVAPKEVWDTCVTVGLVQKFIYFTAAMAGTIGFQTGALNFQGSNLK